MKYFLPTLICLWFCAGLALGAQNKPRNVILILSDDHRYDAMGFMGHPFLQTPHMDALATGGAHFRNMFVTTSLCSPSRATILTGLYAHEHRVVDNNHSISPEHALFPQYLQQAGYHTAFVGKWHMGGRAQPQPGFDHWVSFPGQGNYLPGRTQLNVNGEQVPQQGYITDELTDYAVEWLDSIRGEGATEDRPFFLMLSHKAVHAQFIPAERHAGVYRDARWQAPQTMADTDENYRGKPMWVRNQRNSWHGVDFPYHSDMSIEELYKGQCETLLAMDDSIGRVIAWLQDHDLLDSTLVIYTSDNGFLFGEHGLIDKRCAYEESMRVPLLMRCPELIKPGTKVDVLANNLDIAPTVLDAAGLAVPSEMHGRSLLAPARSPDDVQNWRDHVIYEYYWEWNFPQTPTMHAIRTDRFKYIRYHGVWDIDELYDLEQDPRERNNLIADPQHASTVAEMKRKLFEELERTGGMHIPLQREAGRQQNLRHPDGSAPADFPEPMIAQPKQQ